MTDSMIQAEGLTKTFGDVRALAGMDLSIEAGTVYGLLGPNGAGKTTGVRILTTLIEPDGGKATVAGLDVVHDAKELRSVIGLAGQYAAVDEILTGIENLEMVGRLYGLSKPNAKSKAGSILEQFGLSHAGDRQVRTYSGGMRRRLDLAASLVGEPSVLFLDEPTTGLDPRSRIDLWDFIEDLVDEGTTLLLTTQYLEEADRLADQIGVIDNGTIIAEGTADELKRKVGGDVLVLEVADRSQLQEAADAVADMGPELPRVDAPTGHIYVPVDTPVGVITDAVRRLDSHGIQLRDLAIRRPTLDDVFLTLTGKELEEAEPDEPPAKASRRSKR